jgi:tetratricopeptide (TPR) repeat protein
MYPKAGLLAPKGEKRFVEGVTAYMQGRHDEALAALQEAIRRDPADAHVAEELFAGMALVGLGRMQEAATMLEAVVASDRPIPDALMTKYRISGSMQIGITPAVTATTPMSHVSVALMLAEVYQHTDRPQEAIALLESLGSIAPDPAFALSLAELYTQLGRRGDVLRVTEGFVDNRDDVTAQLLVYRAEALGAGGMTDGALAMLKEALRFRRRSPLVLRAARYVRGLVYEAAGKPARARGEWERIFAEDPTFEDVADRLGYGGG